MQQTCRQLIYRHQLSELGAPDKGRNVNNVVTAIEKQRVEIGEIIACNEGISEAGVLKGVIIAAYTRNVRQ